MFASPSQSGDPGRATYPDSDSQPATAEDLNAASPRLSATLLKAFINALTDENFWIYRMSAQP
jgi:hypothetical protein